MATFPVNIAPGSGAGPIQPQEFYAQTYVFTYVPFNQKDWPLPGRSQPIEQFWALPNQALWIPLRETNKQFRGHLRSLPDQPPPPNAFQSWTYSYNLNLIGKDRFPTGEQFWELPPSQRPYELTRLFTWQWGLNLPLYYQSTSRNLNLPGVASDDLPPAYSLPYRIDQTWTWSYNKNLIGKDRLPVGDQITELPPRDYQRLQDLRTWLQSTTALTFPFVADTTHILRPIWRSLPDQPVQPIQQQSAFQSFNVLQPTAVTFIIRQSDWPLPFAPQQPAQTWTWQYNLNLIGKDRLPTGEQIYDRPTLAIPPAQTWLDLPKYSLIAKPFFQTDWPNPTQPYRLEQTWVRGYNLNLIGQDQLPFRQTDWPLPQVARQPAQTWTDPSKIWLTAPVLNITISQYYDRPQLPIPPAQSWTASYNLNLIGQDRLPVGEAISDLPPRDFSRLFQTWISSVNAALVVTPPVLDILKQQRDWPVPRSAEPDHRRSWEWQYNKNLIGQDTLPFRQQDWPLPTISAQAVQTWIDQTKILLAVQRPFVQTDWPLSFAPQQPAQSWTASYNLNLIGQDRLPNRQQDWPLTPAQGRSADLATWIDRTKFILQRPTAQLDWPNPTPPAREPGLNSFTGRYNLNLIGQDRLPFNQLDWPLSSAHALSQIPLQIMVAGTPFFLVPIQPLPPGVQFHGILYDRFIDPRNAAADITNPSWRWPQITPPAVTGVIPLRTLMGTGV